MFILKLGDLGINNCVTFYDKLLTSWTPYRSTIEWMTKYFYNNNYWEVMMWNNDAFEQSDDC